MPDLLSHVAIAYGAQRCSGRRLSTPWVLIGTIIPDVLSRPFNILFPSVSWFFMPFHTPAGLLLLSALISEFVPASTRRLVVLSLVSGAFLHLFLDLFQKHTGGGYYLFFPFSWNKFEFGLVSPEASLYLFPIWLSVGIYLALRWSLLNQTFPKTPSF
ncbi:MAG TPA: metal-dependent hydrolase [Candidatus Binatia bacterium]|nr:metal-dependent hydrolase [Candidatus Binatia bacterium]